LLTVPIPEQNSLEIPPFIESGLRGVPTEPEMERSGRLLPGLEDSGRPVPGMEYSDRLLPDMPRGRRPPWVG
jgi:hypothetical protein